MKLPISDKFLWDLYTMSDKTGDVLRFVMRPPIMSNWLPGPKNPVFDKYRKDKSKANFSRFIYRLKSKNYIRVKNLQGKEAMMLTKEGLNRVLKASFIMEGKKKRKDGKWIMLIFDVPEKYRKSRNLLRSILHNL